MRTRVPWFGGLLLVALTACDTPPVAWSDPVVITPPSGPARLVVDGAGSARFVPEQAPPLGMPPTPGTCRATVVTASGPKALHAAWWNVRPDSSAILYLAASSDSGRTWGAPIAVDTTDISSTGCSRPSPAIAAVGDDAYIAYSMIAPEGKGVFFAHSMDNMLHSPVPVIYGDRLVPVAIAADAHRVAVAYEEPNGRRAEVGVALSASQGHLFELHTEASRSVESAADPAVAFDGPMLAVSWTTRTGPEATPSRVVRVGRLQPPR